MRTQVRRTGFCRYSQTLRMGRDGRFLGLGFCRRVSRHQARDGRRDQGGPVSLAEPARGLGEAAGRV